MIISQTLYFVLCGVLSIGVLVGIYLLSKVELSVIGNNLSTICMLLAIVLTLVYHDIFDVIFLYVALAIGSIIGLIIAKKVKMIQMPQLVALLNGLGGLASAIVGGFAMFEIGASNIFAVAVACLAMAIGMLTFVGSLIAGGKLHKLITQKPIIYKRHQLFTALSLILTAVFIVVFVCLYIFADSVTSATMISILVMILLGLSSSAFGYLFSIRIGGADMPITISLLNSFSGVAGAIAGLAINDVLLVAVGGIVGASGLFLTQIMCKSMNRSLLDILLAKTTTATKKIEAVIADIEIPDTVEIVEGLTVEDTAEVEDVIESAPKESVVTILNRAKSVIIVPGYGMAIAQAQHLVKTLADKLIEKGATVKYAVHPVAGRMPGHMNVLLCEADVDYEDLYEMDDINEEFATTDVTIVVGANDVINPSAKEAEGTPIYGMPILSVSDCANIVIFNFDKNPGYAGVPNPLYEKANGVTLYLGNASDTLATFLNDLDDEK